MSGWFWQLVVEGGGYIIAEFFSFYKRRSALERDEDDEQAPVNHVRQQSDSVVQPKDSVQSRSSTTHPVLASAVWGAVAFVIGVAVSYFPSGMIVLSWQSNYKSDAGQGVAMLCFLVLPIGAVLGAFIGIIGGVIGNRFGKPESINQAFGRSPRFIGAGILSFAAGALSFFLLLAWALRA